MTTINVTAEHIAKGKRGDCWDCPIALALRSAFPKATNIEVTGTFLNIFHGEQFFETRLPPQLSEFIKDFDDVAVVEPFSFELNYPAVTS